MRIRVPAAPTVQTLRDRFLEVRAYTKALCGPLETEDYVPQGAYFTSPPKWHLAHTTWFFEEMVLKPHQPGYKPFQAGFDFLFNSYYQSLGPRAARAHRGLMTRPTVADVFAYRSYVEAGMCALLESECSPAVEALIEIGLQHEQQHQELFLTDLKYTLGQNPLFPVYDEGCSRVGDTNAENGWMHFPEGIVTIGHDGNGFGFDNEFGHHRVFLEAFEVSKSLVTNGEFLAFMKDGGYRRPEFWLEEGWNWVLHEQAESPLYWHERDGVWHHFTLGGLQLVDEKAILAHVNFFEASAFAQWKGLRLLTEFEWEYTQPHFKWGTRWEWTSSAYGAYPGYQKPDGAVGEYNGKFMVNQMVLRGASVATPPGHVRHTYRNFFHPQMSWQFSGIRLAR